MRELARAHRERNTVGRALEGRGTSSFLWQWARGLVSPVRGAPLLGPAPIPIPSQAECAITFIGHATALIRYAHGRVLTDPCFARSLYSLRRVRAAALPPGALEGISLVLLSHAHSDHLHRPSLERIDRAATLIVPPGCGRADGLGFARVVELEPGASLQVSGIEVTAVHAQHKTGLFGRGRCNGYVVRGQGPTVYFAGDTGYFDGFLEVGEGFHPDVALLPISGYRPGALRGDHLSPLDAIYAFADLRARLMIPIHYGSFPLGYEPLGEPITWLRSLAATRGLMDSIAWLDPGMSCVVKSRPA